MAYTFEKTWPLTLSALVWKAIAAAIAVDMLVLAFILLRRIYRKRYFAKRDARVFELRQKWNAIISGTIPYEEWRHKPDSRRIVESIALDELEVAGPEDSARLLKFLRQSGLIEKRIWEARQFTGWRRMRALVALGRTRAPEGIPALADGLRDRKIEIRLASLRGLGRTACPQAAEAILAWVGERGLSVPALPLQGALIQCSAERPQLLISFLQHAEGPVRAVIGRVLGEVATPSLALDLLQFVGDDLDELRAAAARAMAHTKCGLELDVLSELVGDRVWFVRLRAIVSLGKISDARAMPALMRGLTDAHRLVRLRAAEGLVGLETDMVHVFGTVVASGDRYGLHAYIAALENADLRKKLESKLETSSGISTEEMIRLQTVLRAGAFPATEVSVKDLEPDLSAPLL
jgi:HEAT repeat protein